MSNKPTDTTPDLKGRTRRAGFIRLSTARILSQTFFFFAFLGLFAATTYALLDRAPQLVRWVGKFLEIDPLVGLSTAIATGTLYSGLVFSLIVVLLAILLGRVFCGWICPFGAIHHFTAWLLGRWSVKQRIDVNNYRPMYQAKYWILIALLVMAAGGVVQIGLVDPIATIHRSLTVGVMPLFQSAAPGTFGDVRIYHLAWVIGIILLVIVGLNLVVPRFFCRALCPLGAMLGVLSRFSLWRVYRDPTTCKNCGLCRAHCEGACDPDTSLRKSECMVCFNCIEDCPHGAMRFGFLPTGKTEVTDPDLGRRGVLAAGLAGLVAVPLLKSAGQSGKAFASSVIRPPGSVEEAEFLKRCIKCGQCMKVCPTNVLQPTMLEAGLEGMWTPVMNYRVGFCQLNCTACSQVCPTGAIQRISVEEKLGLGRFATAGPIRLGLASYDLGRCLPWGKATPCVVCEEVCPVSPKAIHTDWQQFVMREGKKMVTAATGDAVTLAEFPKGGQPRPEPSVLRPNSLRGDDSQRFHVKVLHSDGTNETHRIVANSVDTVQIDGTFAVIPQPGDMVALMNEIKVPRVDLTRCIGCGLCENVCVIAGDKRGVYVTAEGESRSHGYGDRDRSIRLIKND